MTDDDKSQRGPSTTWQRSGSGWRSGPLYCQNFGLPPVLDSRDLSWLESIVEKLGSSSWPGYTRTPAFAPSTLQPRLKVHMELAGGVSEVYDEHSKWIVSLDVNHFAPSEIAVRTQDGFLQITGKHDERPDPHGFISRCFIRKYKLPVGVDVETIRPSLTGDGILRVEASAPDFPKPADVILPVQVKMEPSALQEKQQDEPTAGEGAWRQERPEGVGVASPTPRPHLPGEKHEGVSAAGQSADDRLDLPGEPEEALGTSEGLQEGDEEQRETRQSETGVARKQEDGKEELEGAGAALMGVGESMEAPPPTLEQSEDFQSPEQPEAPPTLEQSEDFQSPEQPEAPPTLEQSEDLQSPEQPEAPPTLEQSEDLQSPEQPEAPPTLEQSEDLQSPEQPEAPPTSEQSEDLQSPEQPEAPPTSEQSEDLQSPEQPEAPPTPDTITPEQVESAEVEQGRELQEPEAEGETQYSQAELKHSPTQEEILPQLQENLAAGIKLETAQ